MLNAFTGAQVRSAEAPFLAAGHGDALMQKAAHGLFRVALGMLRSAGHSAISSTVMVLAGPGNNGGDALYAGERLLRRGVAVTAITVAEQVHPDAAAAFTLRGGRLRHLTQDNLPDLAAQAARVHLVIDGILGTGARGGLRGSAAELVSTINTRAGLRGQRSLLVVACDVPSGVNVDTGELSDPVLFADATVTFGAAKSGLLVSGGALAAGELNVVDLGLFKSTPAATAPEPAMRRLEAHDVAALYRRPRTGDHKYTRGVLGIAAGSAQYPGAAVLATGAALATGLGMVRYLGPTAVATIISAVHPEVVSSTGDIEDARSQAWLVGPGAVEDDAQARRARGAIASGLPVVVDAGALPEVPERVGSHVILTPHAGELRTLLASRGIDVARAAIEAAPARYALEVAQLTGATVLLKGFTTITASPTGEVFSQAEAPPWLATAGSGDTLSGILGALVATLAEDDGAAARLGLPAGATWAAVAAAAALIHGLAGERAAAAGPVVVSGLPVHIGSVLADLLAERP
ncbi:NAD(P)H-hydrate epimerase [Arthrobacter sp. Br18]|uniref:NAD(P)H-hydrate epimerase n=1 Tax=Arthrobacter sp. Br18 TaxID=1312954 RepID=UPI00047D255B|nr:NAD(P)H-hydrate epimerase [Arthrobacter sp. Br18]